MAPPAPGPIKIKIKFPSKCKVCQVPLAAGSEAFWEKGRVGVTCLGCNPLKPIPKPAPVVTKVATGPISSGAHIQVDVDEEDFVRIEKFRSGLNPKVWHEIRLSVDTTLVYCTCRGYKTHGHCWHMEDVLRKNATLVPSRDESQAWKAQHLAPPPPPPPTPPPPYAGYSPYGVPPRPKSAPPPTTGTTKQWDGLDPDRLKRINDVIGNAAKKAQPGMAPSSAAPPPPHSTGYATMDPDPPPAKAPSVLHTYACNKCGKTQEHLGPLSARYDLACDGCRSVGTWNFTDLGPTPPKVPKSWFDVLATLEALMADTAEQALKDTGKFPPEMERAYDKYKKMKAMALNPGSANEGRMALKLALIELVKASFT